MTGLFDTRKRSRDEDQCEYLPLSKRINNLHIDNPGNAPQYSESVYSSHMPMGSIMSENLNQYPESQILQRQQLQQLIDMQNNQYHAHQIQQIDSIQQQNLQQQEHLQEFQHQQHQQQTEQLFLGYSQSIPDDQQNRYCNNNIIDYRYEPELTINENPHYYDQNKILFDLYIERMRRLH